MATLRSSAAPDRARRFQASALHWSALLLVGASWLSAAIFGAYILAFFGGTAWQGLVARWNESLPALHDPAAPLATIAIGAHFLTGGILLLLGPVQLIGGLRRRIPALHLWLGRIYVLSAGLAGLAGLFFILARGTIGGTVMNIGFGLYGGLMLLGSILTYRHGRGRRTELHRAWAIRLFALTVGSWLYRMEYGFWFMAVGRTGHSSDFSGWFDAIMVFFFYLPNLVVAELFIRARNRPHGSALTVAAASVLLAASAFVLLATWFFTTRYWAPGMVSGLTGAPR